MAKKSIPPKREQIRFGVSCWATRDEEYLFPRARTVTFDNAIGRALLKAAKVANKTLAARGEKTRLIYGRENGFTCHSLRHTFITNMMEATMNSVQREGARPVVRRLGLLLQWHNVNAGVVDFSQEAIDD